LFIDRPTSDYVGLFGFVGIVGNGGKNNLIQNIGAIDINVTGKDFVGGLVGFSCGMVINSYASGNVTGLVDCVGGLVACIYADGTVNNSYFSGNVTGGRSSIGGLVGNIYNDATVNNSYATGNVTGPDGSFTGGLAGDNGGEVNNSYATGNVNGYNYAGGLVGYLELLGKVDDSYAAGKVTGRFDVGGLVGSILGTTLMHGTVNNSYATGNVTVTEDQPIGGLVGSNSGDVKNSHATGDVKGFIEAGGFVGENWGTVTNSYAMGYVTGTNYTGGFVGFNYGGVMTSFAKGDVKGDYYVGGLAGYNYPSAGDATVTNSYATGNVNGTSEVGGLVGNNNGTVNNTYAVGNVNGGSQVGGLVGCNNGTVSYCFWDNETSGRTSSDGGTGKTTVEMKTRSTFTNAGWDFNNVWFMIENETYPYLRNMSVPPANHAPTITTSPVTAATADSLYSVQYQATDPDGDSLSWNMTSNASWLNMTSDGLLSGTPSSSDSGTYVIAISVSDGKGGTASLTFELTVSAKHLISWTNVPGNANLTEGDNYTFTAKATDTYSELNLAYSITTAENCSLTINTSTGDIQWHNMTAGNYHFTLSATDGELTINHDFVLSVAKKHTIAWTEVPGDTDLTEGDNYTFTARATDTYPEHILAYSVNSTGNTSLSVNSSTGTIAWYNVTAGNYSFTLSATDGELTISHDFVLSVARKQEPFLAPYIVSVTGPENITVKASSVQTFSVEATSPSGANLTYEWKENGATLGTEKTFSHKFPPGNHTLILLIGDGRYTTTRTFNFTVAPPSKTIETKPVSVPGFEVGVAAAAIALVVTIGLFLRRERR
jgi:hypothetical protein